MSTTYHTQMPSDGVASKGIEQIGRFLSIWWRSYRVWRNQQLAVAALRRLDNRMLKDLGIDRSEITSVVRTGGRDRHPKFRGQWSVLKWL